LPGDPVLVAQNMPGASSVVAANYLFWVTDCGQVGTSVPFQE